MRTKCELIDIRNARLHVGDVRSWRNSKADASWSFFSREESFQFGTKQMSGKTKGAILLVENCHQIIRYDVPVRV